MLSFQAMVKTAATSSWTALRNRGFRLIWLASVISGACASAHGTAATWAVNELSHSTLLLSMMSTFSSLPFFLFTLPAGALADIVDRAKLVRITHVLVSSLSRRPRDSRLVASPQWPPHTALLPTFKLLSSPLSIDFTQRLSFELGAVTPMSQNLNCVPQPRDGPVLITIDFQVDETRGRELDSFMNELRLIHLRNGAYSWQLFADPAQPNHFHVEIMMPSWSQYLLHCERITKAEKEVIDRALSLNLEENPPETRMYIRVSKTFGLHR